jgi:DNA-binding CsgD family transcriptional regulator/tetratricopeptide (TPR) repeat protein
MALWDRDRVLARIGDGLRQAAGSSVSIIKIEGNPGSGKTALCTEASHRAVAAGFRSARIVGVEGELDLPLAGLSTLLRQVIESVEAATLPEGQRHALAAALGADDMASRAPGADRFALGAAVLGALAVAADETPLLIVIDDAQWLDAASAEALSFAFHRLQRDQIAIMVASRIGQRPLVLPTETVNERLDGLAEGDIGAMLTDAGLTCSHEVARRLVVATGGLPLALLETASALTSGQRRGAEPLPEILPIGENVTRAYRERLRDLPAPTVTSLALLAIAGGAPRAAYLVAAETLRLNERALEPAEVLGILEQGPNTVGFTHPLLRAAAVELPDAVARRGMHRALAAALPSDDVERRAHHLFASAVRLDQVTAATLDAAGVHAESRGAPYSASDFFWRAAELSPPGPDRIRRLVAAARAATQAGRTHQAHHLARRVLDTGGTTSRQRLDAALSVISSAFWAPVAEEFVNVAVEEAHRVAGRDPEVAALALTTGSMLLQSRGRVAAASRIAEQALRYAQRVTADAGMRTVLDTAGVRVLSGRHSAGRELLSRWSPRASDLLSDREISGGRDPGTILTLCRLGRFHQAEDLFHALRRAGQQNSAPSDRAFLLGAAGELFRSRGDWPRALALLAQATTLAEQTSQHLLIGYLYGTTARVLANTGQSTQVRSHVSKSMGIADTYGVPPIEVYAMSALGSAELSEGAFARAAEHLSRASRAAFSGGAMDPVTLDAGADLVEALFRAGATDRAEAELSRHTRLAENSGVPWAIAVMRRAAALLASDPVEKDQLFADAVQAHPPEVPFDLARTRLYWGQHRLQHGDQRGGHALLRAALTAFTEIGACPWAERARAGLGNAEELTQEPASGPDLAVLSAQEMNCALAVADGMTNRQAAAALFISTKTVEYHLSRIYTKLGISSRTHLVKLVTTHLAAPRRTVPDPRAGQA